MSTRNGRSDWGFALIEVLAVMLIAGCLATIGASQYSHWREKTYLTTVRVDAKQIGDALQREVADGTVTTGLVVQDDEDVTLDGREVGTVSNHSKVTGFNTYDGEVIVSVYRGEDPESALAYASYSSVKGGLCRSGFGPVQPCDPLQGVGDNTETDDDPPAPAPTQPPATVEPPSGVGDETETDDEDPPAPSVAEIVNPTAFVRSPVVSGLACKDGSKIVNDANSSGATRVNLTFEWSPVAGATKYDVHLTPLQPGGAKESFKTTVVGTTVSFPMPRPKTQWGNPIAGQDTSYYGQYSIRVLPHVDGRSGDPQYTTLQYEHWSIGCWGNVTFDNQRPPLPMYNPNSLTYTIEKNDSKTTTGYADVTFRWTGVEGATKYRISVFTTDKNKKWGADRYVSDPELLVRFPRKQLDQYNNPVGGQNADYYDTYWVRIQPIGTSWDSDARYRMFRYYHHDQGLHSPDGYY
ncbi:Tfp pilus assembly protein FimT/FimU [Aeromicrobium sp. 179-A 4D2 NHS]|uniref:pilus assembly FimT family protein n=1 Tax=Aeromicrobium sp. 179-A 4D2 NHS TaxID=3142375 RepID=UPI0039A15CC9